MTTPGSVPEGSTSGPVDVRTVPAADTRPLRHLVLRPGQPAESTVYPGDDDPDTRHLAAFVDGQLVGIASIYREARSGADIVPGWRLRGMATSGEARGKGVGRALLSACLLHVAAEGGGEVWCNARAEALGFYAAAGFEVVGEEFEIPDIGPHRVMRRDVARSA
jgi:predicted GNAT family N-acyltransferase